MLHGRAWWGKVSAMLPDRTVAGRDTATGVWAFMADKRTIAERSRPESGAEAAQGLYADPSLYDILYTPGTAAEIDALERVERSLAPGRVPAPGRLWFEPACGTGRCLRVAAARGRRVSGFDREPAMLAYATARLAKGDRVGAGRRTSSTAIRAARPRLFQADLADFAGAAAAAGLRPGSVDFAFITVNSLRHLETDRAMLAHFAQVRDLLRPGGLYVVGISLTDYDWLWPDEDLWAAVRGSCRVSQLINWLPPEPGTPRARLERAISHLTVTRPGRTDHLDDAYDLRCYDIAQWRRLVGRSALDHVGSFDARGRPLPPGTWPYQLEALRRA